MGEMDVLIDAHSKVVTKQTFNFLNLNSPLYYQLLIMSEIVVLNSLNESHSNR